MDRNGGPSVSAWGSMAVHGEFRMHHMHHIHRLLRTLAGSTRGVGGGGVEMAPPPSRCWRVTYSSAALATGEIRMHRRYRLEGCGVATLSA